MIDLSTKYMGLELKNPLVVGSCGLTNNLSDIKDLEKNGAAAVVLKSIFEEEILSEYEHELKNIASDESNYEYYDYLDYKIKEDNLKAYIKLIESCKKEVEIPIIASINCLSTEEWMLFAKKIEKAGADAIELNAFLLPSDLERSSAETEQIYFAIVDKIKKEIKIPVSLKISYYFSNLAMMIQKLSETGLDSLVLFNRFYSPDIDINKKRVVATNVFSSSSDISVSLRWIAIMANRVSCDLASSTGVHDGEGLIKQLLVGANIVQVVSTLYKNGNIQIKKILDDLKSWMENNNYDSIADFRGLLSQDKVKNPSIYERVQFMKYFADRK